MASRQATLRHRNRLRPATTLGVIASLCLTLTAARTHADTVTLLASRIALHDCTIQAISGAQVFYIDPTGQRQKRAVEEVWALGFEGNTALDEAEQSIADRDYDAARKHLLEAMIATDSSMQHLWIRNRLIRVHGLRDEYAEACANLAEIFMLDPDPYWARIEPRCDAVPTTYAAAVEAMEALQRADRAVKIQALQTSINKMMVRVAPLRTESAKTYDGPPIEPDSTISGIAKSRIGKWDDTPQATTPTTSPDHPKPETNTPTTSTPKPISTPPSGPESADAIDSLLAEHRYGDAMNLCQRIAAHIDGRDLAQFLFQFGESLRGAGKPADAAIMYMRAAVLFPASTYAGPCLIETALLYRDAFGRPDTARSLLERVAQDAERAERPELAQRARTLLKDLAPANP